MESVLYNPDLLYNLLLDLDYEDVINYCRSYKQAALICQTPSFWEQKVLRDFNIPLDIFRNTDLSPAQRYLQISTSKGEIAKGSEQYLSLDEFVKRAILQDREDLLSDALTLGFGNPEVLLKAYTRKGDQVQVDYYLNLIHNNYKYQTAVEEALKGGHRELFDHILSVTPQNAPLYIPIALRWAAESGNIQLYNYILTLVPELDMSTVASNIGSAFLASGNKELFDSFRRTMPATYDWEWEALVSGAVKSGRKELIDYMVSLVPTNYDLTWDVITDEALRSGNKELFDYIRSLAPYNYNWDWNVLAEQAIVSGNQDLVDYVMSLAPNDYQWNWWALVYEAVKAQNISLFNDIIDQVPHDYELDWNSFLIEAVYINNQRIFDEILELVPKDYRFDWRKVIGRAEGKIGSSIMNCIKPCLFMKI